MKHTFRLPIEYSTIYIKVGPTKNSIFYFYLEKRKKFVGFLSGVFSLLLLLMISTFFERYTQSYLLYKQPFSQDFSGELHINHE